MFILINGAFEISNLDYLTEIQRGLARSDRPTLHFCLTAPLDVVRARLRNRGEVVEDPRGSWVHRRAAECCEAHQHASFGMHIPTEARPSSAVAADLAARVGQVRS